MYERSKLFTLPLCEGEMEPWRKVLLDAADIMRERGQSKGCALGPNREVCVSAAITEASGYNWNLGEPAMDKLREYFHRTSLGQPIAFNDRADTSADEMIRALRECAR